MQIYTYYENINFSLQDELLSLWEKSWTKHGFTPIVLSRKDAQKSPLYNQYYDFIQRVHSRSVNKILSENSYCLAAQLEIVAFHTIEIPSYISDYDMINNGFNTGEILESMVYWRNAACSCFASGDKNGWEKYIMFLFEQEDRIIRWCKNQQTRSGRNEFHDQDFLEAIAEIGIKQKIYKMSRNLDIIGASYTPDQKNICKIPHLSHNNMAEILSNNPKYSQYSSDELRLLMANQILNNS